MKVLNIEEGIIETAEQFTDDEKAYIEILKKNKCFTVGNHHFAGYCLKCGKAILEQDARYIENKNGHGTIAVDAYHRWCKK
jgi:hypothetical protein